MAQGRGDCERDEETSRFINCREFNYLVKTDFFVKPMRTCNDSLHDLLIMIGRVCFEN